MPSCDRCGAYVLPDEHLCSDCVRASEGDDPADEEIIPPAPPPPQSSPTQAVWALILGLVSVFFCPLAGPFAIWLGVQSQRRGEADGLATVGIVLGVLGCLMLLATIVAIGLFITFAATSSALSAAAGVAPATI